MIKFSINRCLTPIVACILVTTVFISPAAAQSTETIGVCAKNDKIKSLADSADECKNNEEFLVWNVQGVPGLPGANGAQGLPGSNGVDGAQGVAGIDGTNGAPGIDGTDGTPGLDGINGTPGATGADGADGVDAPDRTLDICILYSALPALLAPDYCPAAPTYAIGDTGPGGGIVVHVTDGGLHGLEVAPLDQSRGVIWCGSSTNIVGVDNIRSSATVDTNSGAVNTPLIAAVCGASSAAGVAAAYVWPNGQTDGFLPNKEELHLLYLNRLVWGGFVNVVYWSSSESDLDRAWLQDFFDGFQVASSKNDAFWVRAVRAF